MTLRNVSYIFLLSFPEEVGLYSRMNFELAKARYESRWFEGNASRVQPFNSKNSFFIAENSVIALFIVYSLDPPCCNVGC